MTTSTITTDPPLETMGGLERANSVEAIIRAHEDEIENERSIPNVVADALWDIGMFTSFVPRECGGWDPEPIEWLRMVERLSAINGSVGWLAMNNCGFFMNYMTPEVFEPLKGDKGRYVQSISVGRWGGVAKKVDGGYRISGRWPFLSGSQHATYVGGASILHDENDEVVIHPDGLPWLIIGQWPKEQATLLDTWDGLGLRGTSSGDMVVEDLFVPRHMVNEGGFGQLTYDRPKYRIRLLAVHAHTAHAIGLAQAALDEFLNLMNEAGARGSVRKMVMGNQQVHQMNYARADAMVRAARLFAYQSVEDAMANAEHGRDIDLEHKVLLRQSMVYTKHACKEAVDLIFHMAGSSAVFKGRPLERIYRDMATAYNHVLTADYEYASVGSYYLTRNLPGGPHLVGRKLS